MAPITPLERYKDLAKAIGASDVYLKREDLHPYGSHKGRSIPVMIDAKASTGDRRFVISSSGNAALAAALYAKDWNAASRKKEIGASPLDLTIYIGTHADPAKATKIKALEDGKNVRVLVKERPLQAVTAAVKEGATSLRQSNDDTALLGYQSLVEELAAQHNKIGAVFIGTSSGTTAQALAQGFLDKEMGAQVHIVQTSSCHPMSAAFEPYDGPHERSVAGAIVDTVALRKPVLVPLVEKTGGRGWTATNDEILAAQDMVREHAGLEISVNSALSIAGLIQATEIGWEYDGAAICMICGD